MAMLLVEILLPVVLALVIGYGAVAYRLGLPSPVESRHARALVHIAALERELGVGLAPPPELPADVRQLGERTLRGRQLGIDLTSPAPPRNLVSVAGNAFSSTLRAARGYDGPALTDADVRRREHPEEFP